jgi:hypothetical protein
MLVGFVSFFPHAKELEMAVFLPNVQCSFKTVTVLQQVYRHFLCRSIKFWRICNISPRCSIQSRKYNFPLKFDGFFRWRVPFKSSDVLQEFPGNKLIACKLCAKSSKRCSFSRCLREGSYFFCFWLLAFDFLFIYHF